MRADDGQSSGVNAPFNALFPKNHGNDARSPQNQTDVNGRALPRSNRSTDSPAPKWEQTAKFGPCPTNSMSNSMSPGLASQAKNQGTTTQMPKEAQQKEAVTQFQQQEREGEASAAKARAAEEENARQQAALEKQAKELERERTRLQEDNEAWRREMQEQTRKELEEEKRRAIEEALKEQDKRLRELSEQLRLADRGQAGPG